MEQLAVEIVGLCREYGECRVDAERREEARDVANALESVCVEAGQRLDISDPALLLALLDACEVTRDEGMLQEVLDAVSEVAEELKASPLHVKLLAYCYFYTEDEECAELAKRMLERLRADRSVTEAELEKAREIYGELVEESGC